MAYNRRTALANLAALAAPTDDEPLNLKEETLVRVYADISKDAEMKMRIRCLNIQQETGKRITRKEYLEKLIADDVAKVKGASLREIKSRR